MLSQRRAGVLSRLARAEWRASPLDRAARCFRRLGCVSRRISLYRRERLDAELAFPFEPGPPSAKTLSPTRRVPGSPAFAQTAWDACQALAWLAKERKDPRERLERMLQIPELMQALMSGG
jgi:hypothetical protein